MTYNLPPELEWDLRKNISNQEKHGISFHEAKELFESGVDFLEIYDGEHSFSEERFVAIGPIRRGIVVVIWTERSENRVRMISARFATPREANEYRKRIGDSNE